MNKVVRDYQYLLAHNRFRNFKPGKADGEWGPLSRDAVKHAKWELGYAHVDGKMGEELYRYLLGPKRGGKRLTPAMLLRRVKRLRAMKKTAALRARQSSSSIREKIVAYWRWGVDHEPSIHYRQVRPFPVGREYSLPMYTDCSGFFSLGYHVAGAADPNDQRWNGQGYTGTLLDHGRRVSKEQAKPGDAVVFGSAPGHHVCGVLQGGSDPILVSHGQEAGPQVIRFSDELRAQGYRPYAFINYLD